MESDPQKISLLNKNPSVDWLWVLTDRPLFACPFHRPTGFPSFLKWSWALPLRLYLPGLAPWLSLLSGGNTFLSFFCWEYLGRIWSCVPPPDRLPIMPCPIPGASSVQTVMCLRHPEDHEGSGDHRRLTHFLDTLNRSPVEPTIEENQRQHPMP